MFTTPAPSASAAGAPTAPASAPDAPLAYAATGAKLGRAVLAYVVAVVLVITLEPFRFGAPTTVRLLLWNAHDPWGGWFDVAANVALFSPLGFVAALTRAAGAPRRDVPRLTWALIGGLVLSSAIELTQCFEPGRYPSPTDVAANAAGAWLGAWLHRRAAGHLGADSPVVGRLALELPVMGLVYVALPLLTLVALTAGAGPRLPLAVAGGPLAVAPRALGLVALGAFGGTLLGTVQRRQFGPAGAASAAATAGVAALWFAVGALPAAATARGAYAAGLAAAAATAWLVGRRGVWGVRAVERRFEGEALGRAAPWLAAYLALVPLGDVAGAALGRLTILRDLEAAAGFAVLGYALAEAWGRREWRYRHSAWRVALAAAGAAAVAAAVSGGLPAPNVWSVLGAAGVAARAASAAFGGWVYHLQRAHVRALVAARRRAPRSAPSSAAPAGARAA